MIPKTPPRRRPPRIANLNITLPVKEVETGTSVFIGLNFRDFLFNGCL
jgi:hypothetical protein